MYPKMMSAGSLERSRKHFLEDYLPLADEWGVWDNQVPPSIQIAREPLIRLPI